MQFLNGIQKFVFYLTIDEQTYKLHVENRSFHTENYKKKSNVYPNRDIFKLEADSIVKPVCLKS